MTDKVPIRRLPTGVPGLDAVLGGGVPEFSFNLIAGTPGAGKTTLVQQIMFALARRRSARPLLHGARRTAAQDAPLPAAVRVLRRGEGERVGAVHQPGEGGAGRRARRGAEAHRPGSGGGVARAS